ncbi:MAG: hypothetical protein ACKVOB_05230 [Sphingomonas sp.]
MAKTKTPSSADTPPATDTGTPDATTSSAAATVVKDKATATANEAASTAQTVKDAATKATKQAGDKARELVSESTTRAAGALSEVSRMVHDAAETVDEKIGPQYGRYARSAAEALSNFSDTLKEKNADDLIEDARGFVRKSPAVAIGIAAALGFVVARVVKAGFNTADNDDEKNA